MSAEIVIYDTDGKAYQMHEVEKVFQERDTLASAIVGAAFKAGIYNGEVQATGPHLIMFLDDMADYTKHLENELASLVEYNKSLENTNNIAAVRDNSISFHIKQVKSAKSLAYRDAQLEELIKVWEASKI